jgi:hypothetical protein
LDFVALVLILLGLYLPNFVINTFDFSFCFVFTAQLNRFNKQNGNEARTQHAADDDQKRLQA